jgi:predicted nucleotidyltransferase
MPMQREQILHTLRMHHRYLAEQYGVQSLALFGSVARNEANERSDVDLIVEFSRPVGYFGLFALQDYLSQMLGHPVDVGTLPSLKPRLRQRIEQDLIHVF